MQHRSLFPWDWGDILWWSWAQTCLSGQWCDQRVDGGGSWSWVDSAKTSEKSEQKSGREISLGFSALASSVDMVTLLMFSSRGGYSQRDLSTLGEKLIENMFQLMMGFHFCNQGIPRIIWGWERRMTMNLTVSEKSPEEKEMTEVQRIVPLELGVPSTL